MSNKGVIRRALTRRFPYGVFFVEGERSVPVIAVPTRSGTLEFGKNGADNMRAEKFANQTLHQTPDSPAVLAGAVEALVSLMLGY